MTDKIQLKVQNLELLLRLKSLIMKASNIDSLLSQVCNVIVELDVYEVSWAMLLGDDGNTMATFSSDENTSSREEYGCLQDTLEKPELFLHKRDSEKCKNCILLNSKKSTLISKRLDYGGAIYGVFSVSVENHILDLELKVQFEDLVDNISYAIHSIHMRENRTKLQRELIESRNMYKSLLNTSSIALGIMDLESHVIFMSNPLKRILGYADDDTSFVEERVKGADFVTEDSHERVAISLREVLENDVINTNDYIFVSKDKRRIHMRLRTSLMRDASREPIGFMVVFNDLATERKTADALVISEQQFRLTFMKAPNGVALLNSHGIILDCNEKDAEMIQMKRSDMIGKHIKSFLEKGLRNSFDERFSEFKKTGSKELIVNLVRKDGKVLSVARSVSAFYDLDGSLRGIIVHSRDITAYLEAQQKIKILSLAIEQSSSMFAITDVEGNITYVNKKFEEVTGYMLEDANGQNPNILKSGMHSDAEYADMWSRLNNGGIWKGELCNKRKDESLYWEYASMSVVRNEEGKITNMLKVAEDITARRESEIEIQETTIRYRNIFNLVPSPIIIHQGGVIVDVNKAALLFSKGKSVDVVMGTHVLNFVHESSREETISRMKRLEIHGGEMPIIEAKYVNLDGEVRNVRSVSKEVSFKGERAFMVVFEDITKDKLAEHKLLESEKKFRDIFNLNPDPVSIAGLESGVILEVNDAFLHIFNKKREDVVGVSSYDISIYENSSDRDEIVSIIKEKGYLLNHEITFNINGERITTLVSASLLGAEKEGRILFVARDISKRKKMERVLVESKEKAERGERLKSSFLSNMSHEIRTPMNAILGFSDLLRDSEISTHQRNKYVNIIQQRGSSLLKMISDIMDISQIESNTLEVVMHAVKIQDLSRDVVDKAHIKLEKDSNKRVSLEYHSGIKEDVLISGDKYRIRQVLNDLVDNAIKFTSEGSVMLRCWLEGKQVIFEIEDTGIGIASDGMNRVFERFVQLHDGTDMNVAGAGLGLSLAKSLLELMGSELKIESTLGYGTKVRFALHLYDGREANVEIAPPKSSLVKDWKNKTLLIAEDEPSNQMFLKVILAKTGVKTIMANDGQEALDLFSSHKEEIDLVLVDVRMPKMNGYELTREIKQQSPHTIVIALTANAMNNDRQEAILAGCDDYLSKPIAKELLLNTIEKYL